MNPTTQQPPPLDQATASRAMYRRLGLRRRGFWQSLFSFGAQPIQRPASLRVNGLLLDQQALISDGQRAQARLFHD